MKKRPSISLSMIARDVDMIIGPCLETVVPFVDEVVIVDTGSQDRTRQKILEACPKAKIFEFTEKTNPESFLLDSETTWEKTLPEPFTGRPFLSDFAAARQSSLEKCTSDYVLWMDSDDVLNDGHQIWDLLATMERTGCETALLPYHFTWDEQGAISGSMVRDRIWKRRPDVHWQCPVHEVLVPSRRRRTFEGTVHVAQAFGRHPSKQRTKVSLRNLKILMHWHRNTAVAAPDSRLLYYLADEEVALWPEDACLHFQECYERSIWDAERGKAHLGAGKVHERMGRHSSAFSEYAMAAIEAPFDPDSLFSLARLAHAQKQHEKCIEWTDRGRDIWNRKDARDLMPYDVRDRTWRPAICYAGSLYALGHWSGALAACEDGLRRNPGCPELLAIKVACERRTKLVLPSAS